jgi:hypothetical protein
VDNKSIGRAASESTAGRERGPASAQLEPIAREVESWRPGTMATVIADVAMSLDGFIADRPDNVGSLFDWYRVGPVTTASADEQWSFHTSEASAWEALDLRCRIWLRRLVAGRC